MVVMILANAALLWVAFGFGEQSSQGAGVCCLLCCSYLQSPFHVDCLALGSFLLERGGWSKEVTALGIR